MTMARRLFKWLPLLLVAPALLLSCKPFGLRDVLEAATQEIVSDLNISPSSITVIVNSEVQFEVAGGTGPIYTFDFSGSPGSGSLRSVSATGLYKAGSIPGTTDVIRVTDSASTPDTHTATVTVVSLESAVNYDITSIAGLPDSGVAGEPITGSPYFTVTNVGLGDGAVSFEWTAYLSTNADLDAGDVVVCGGFDGPLASGVAIDLELFGTYPSGPNGIGNLIVTVEAADDTSPIDNSDYRGFELQPPPSPNYIITPVPLPTGSTTGQPVNGNFTITNTGSGAGTSAVSWWVYASLGNNSWDAGDTLLDNGSIGGLPALVGSASPAYSGTWPSTAGNYFIVVHASTADDPSIADAPTSVAVSVTAPPPPDYQVINPVFQPTGTRNMAFSGTHSFKIQNTVDNPGTKNITWRVYRSLDATLDGLDTMIATASIAPLGPSETTPSDISYSGTWPDFGSYYWLIVTLEADDDPNPVNNTWISSAIEVPYLYTENHPVENNGDSGPTPPAFSNVSDYFITLQVDQLIRINGTMDAGGAYDTYRFTAGPGQTSIEIKVLWTTGFDDCDVYWWDESGRWKVSQDYTANMEPDSPPFAKATLVPGQRYYIGVFFFRDGGTRFTSDPYQLYLYGRP